MKYIIETGRWNGKPMLLGVMERDGQAVHFVKCANNEYERMKRPERLLAVDASELAEAFISQIKAQQGNHVVTLARKANNE